MRKLSPILFTSLQNEQYVCETCIKAKSHRTTYPDSSNKTSQPIDLIHTNVWGLFLVVSKSDCRWFILFTDDHTRMTWVYLLKTKNEVPQVFQAFFSHDKNSIWKGDQNYKK
jgi:hypothetical protein